MHAKQSQSTISMLISLLVFYAAQKRVPPLEDQASGTDGRTD